MSRIKRAYKYRCYPSDEQKRALARTFGCCRWVYNFALSLKSTTYRESGKSLSYEDLSALLPLLKQQPETAWLADVSAVVLQQSLRHLETAFTNFFEGRTGYPSYHTKSQDQAATYTKAAFSLCGSDLTLARMAEPLKIVWSRPLPQGAHPSSVTISKDRAERYFVSFALEEGVEALPPIEHQVGIDLGLTSMVALSTGELIGNPKFFAAEEKKLARTQRRLARKTRGSKNRAKARQRVARLHARIADKRRDFQHKLSTCIIRENQTVCVETLAVKNMLRNHALAKAISDVGWGEFVRQLQYKAAWYGRTLLKVDRWYPSSKTCSACGDVLESLDLDEREWTCPSCLAHHDRDLNAAKCVLAEGLRVYAEGLSVSACGRDVRPNLHGTREGSLC
jgi:putative transposase